MAKTKTALFEPIVPIEKLHPKFEVTRKAKAAICARAMLNSVYEDFTDLDGNFVEQFQTTGFDARYFELYLFAYLTRSGYSLDRAHAFPDFLVERNGVRVAIEATTTNPSTSGAFKDAKKIAELSPTELADYLQNELAIRFGGPLHTKLRKRYWELPHCSQIPFVLAIEAFHDDESLGMTDNALMKYAYGSNTLASWSNDAELLLSNERIEKHAARGKELASHFFGQPDTENISAILFTNSGTHSKFSRMGYQHGFHTDGIIMFRAGRSYTPDPNAMDPTYFTYRLSEPPFVETWGQGISVIHNPNARFPLPKNFFVDAVQVYWEEERIVSEYCDWHPLSSKTATFHVGGGKNKRAVSMPAGPSCMEVIPISRDEFRHFVGNPGPGYVASDGEHGWFADSSRGFYGLLLQTREGIWKCQIYVRDEFFNFYLLQEAGGIPLRELAVEALQLKIGALAHSPQRIFPRLKTLRSADEAVVAARKEHGDAIVAAKRLARKRAKQKSGK